MTLGTLLVISFNLNDMLPEQKGFYILRFFSYYYSDTRMKSCCPIHFILLA